MTKEEKLVQQRKDIHEFLDKLAALAAEYQFKITGGEIIGGLEIVKMKVFMMGEEARERKEEFQKFN